MSPYETPSALRQALESRLLTSARSPADVARLRRVAAFERFLVRLDAAEPGSWVLKGGLALEVRLGRQARATKDLDLAVRDSIADAGSVRERVVTALQSDPFRDGFRFEVGTVAPLAPDLAGQAGWRLKATSSLAGRLFEPLQFDVVARETDIAPAERLRLPGFLSFAGFPPGEFDVVARTQHFAEKLHALTRSYGTRDNTRVRDLPDLLLLIDQGFDDLAELHRVVRAVFATRGTHDVPRDITTPPAAWANRYVELAADLELPQRALVDAVDAVRAFWSTVVSQGRG